MNSEEEVKKIGFIGSLITPQGTMEMVNVVLNLTTIVLSWFSITVEPFWRHTFGSRYLSPLRLLLAWMTFQTYQMLYFLIVGLFGLGNPMGWLFNTPNFNTLFGGGVHSFLYHLFVYGFVGLSVLHLISIAKRQNEGQLWHTSSFGISWLSYLPWEAWEKLLDVVFLVVGRLWNELLRLIPVPLVRDSLAWLGSQVPVALIKSTLQASDWKFYCVIEPLLTYLAARALMPTDGLLGTWLLLASIALFLKNMMIYASMRGRIHDLTDSKIESAYLQAALKGEDKRKTAGFTVVPVSMQFTERGEIITAPSGQRSESVHS